MKFANGTSANWLVKYLKIGCYIPDKRSLVVIVSYIKCNEIF